MHSFYSSYPNLSDPNLQNHQAQPLSRGGSSQTEAPHKPSLPVKFRAGPNHLPSISVYTGLNNYAKVFRFTALLRKTYPFFRSKKPHSICSNDLMLTDRQIDSLRNAALLITCGFEFVISICLINWLNWS